MTALEQCERVTIEIHRSGKRPGWRFGDLGLHKFGDTQWQITHLPSGLALRNGYCLFDDIESGAEAMIEISRLRNSWDFVELTKEQALELRDQVAEIAKRHGGKLGGSQRYSETYRGGFNGYPA